MSGWKLSDRLIGYARKIAHAALRNTMRIARIERELAHLTSRTDGPLPRPYYYLGGNRALTQLSNGLPFFVNTDDKGVASWIILIGQWETFVDEVLTGLCDPGMRVLDLGANLGYYTIRLANIVGPTGHVLSLEPNPAIFPFLRDNVEINAFQDRVRAEQVAASAEAGSMELQFDLNNMGGGSLFGLPPELATGSAQVQTVRLDELCAGQPGFDLIKIDLEGWEPQAFLGMTEVLGRSAHASIVCEVSWGHWQRFGDPATILKRLLGDRDGLFLIHKDGGLQRVDTSNPEAFRDQLGYALLTHWDDDKERRLGHLLRA